VIVRIGIPRGMVIESAGFGPGQVLVAPRWRPCSGLDPDRLLLDGKLLDRRGELVALRGPKPFFGTLSLPFSSIAYPRLGSSSALVTPRPGIGGCRSCWRSSWTQSVEQERAGSGIEGSTPGFEGTPGWSPALGDPSALYNPGVLGVAPELGTGEGTQDPGAVGVGCRRWPRLHRPGAPPAGGLRLEVHPRAESRTRRRKI
jgi:hypothetical protein